MSTIFEVAKIDLNECDVFHLRLQKKPVSSIQSPAYFLNKLCRNFLSNPEFTGCLISPKRRSEELLVVGLREVFDKHAFTQWMSSENMTVTARLQAFAEDVVTGMRFSLAFSLESEGWYRVGNSFMTGSFLRGERNGLPRIQFEPLCSTEGRICFRVRSDFVNMQVLEQWMYKSKGTGSLCQRWVFCLPKLGFGRIIKMHRSLPHHSPFGSYKEMRDYWKISYGYDLPKADPDAYYDVVFNGSRTPFLYPYFCVLAEKPETVISHQDYDRTKEAIETFAKALTSTAKVICGQTTRFNEQCGEEARMRSLIFDIEPICKKKLDVKIGDKRPSLMKSAFGIKRSADKTDIDFVSPVKSRFLGMRSLGVKPQPEASIKRPFFRHFNTPTKPATDRLLPPAAPIKAEVTPHRDRSPKSAQPRFRKPVVDVE